MSKRMVFFLLVLFITLSIIIFLPSGIAPNTVGGNYKNVTVRTQVNISNSKPEILNVSIYESTNASLKNITINAGGLKTIYCNATVRDWNGFNDISKLNATIWHVSTSTSNGTDNNNNHYTNLSCTLNASTSTYVGWYVCSFDVMYYSNNGTWMCNVTIEDYSNTFNSGNGSTTFYPVYALNVTDGIDYGTASVEDFTTNATANITNLGNMAINVTVEGYGASKGDGLAMNCTLGGNITIANERFSTSLVDYGSKIPLSSSIQLIPNLTIIKQTTGSPVINTTFWQLYTDSSNNPGGNCTGYIIFTAIAQ